MISLKAVLELLKIKDKNGVSILYENYYKAMYSISFSVVQNSEISKDAVQNSIIKLWLLDAKKFPSCGEYCWLFTLIKNETLMLIRKEKSCEDITQYVNIGLCDMDIECLFDMDYYNSLISTLNEFQKEIITLKVLGGLTHKEIAMLMNKPIGTIQWTYNMSIKTLRKKLASLCILTLSSITVLSANSIYAIKYISSFNNFESTMHFQPNLGLLILLIAVSCLSLTLAIFAIKKIINSFFS
ncbi:MAG: sigma-70 family RNA polymerase sigma factor [Bacillota bacterium]